MHEYIALGIQADGKLSISDMVIDSAQAISQIGGGAYQGSGSAVIYEPLLSMPSSPSSFTVSGFASQEGPDKRSDEISRKTCEVARKEVAEKAKKECQNYGSAQCILVRESILTDTLQFRITAFDRRLSTLGCTIERFYRIQKQ